jgi:hypothetical protein
MAKKIKHGNIEIPEQEFRDENVTAHISIRMPMTLLKDLRRLSLTEEYEGRYQILMKDILTKWVEEQKTPKRKRA